MSPFQLFWNLKKCSFSQFIILPFFNHCLFLLQIIRENSALKVDGSLMRLYVAKPLQEGCWPGILFYSDIYQLGPPITRLADRLAGYGYVVAAPEIFHRREPLGTIIEPNDLGRLRGNDNALSTSIAAYDDDASATLQWLDEHPSVRSECLGTIGFCLGGHIAFRAALSREVKATVCIYPTGLQDGKLGIGIADSLERASEIGGSLFTIFGSLDPHVSPEARQKILANLASIPNLNHQTSLFECNHTFMRDDGARWDPQRSDECWNLITQFLDDKLKCL